MGFRNCRLLKQTALDNQDIQGKEDPAHHPPSSAGNHTLLSGPAPEEVTLLAQKREKDVVWPAPATPKCTVGPEAKSVEIGPRFLI